MENVLSPDRTLKNIIAAVCLAHLVLILWIFQTGEWTPPLKKPGSKLAVKTIRLNPPMQSTGPIAPSKPVETPPKPIPAEQPLAMAEIPSKPQPKPEPPAITEKAKPKLTKSAAKPTPPKPMPQPAKPKAKEAAPAKKAPPKPAPKKIESKVQEPNSGEQAAKAKQKETLARAKEMVHQLESIKTSAAKPLPTTFVPSAVADLQIDSLPNEPLQLTSLGESNYRDEIAAHLKYQLKLPEYGEVKLKLTLSRTGGVDKIEVTTSASTANKKYVEAALPKLKFPPFGKHFNQAAHYTFVISLNNE